MINVPADVAPGESSLPGLQTLSPVEEEFWLGHFSLSDGDLTL